MSTVSLTKEKMVKFCGNCGNQLLDEDRVCGNCGKVISMISKPNEQDRGVGGTLTSSHGKLKLPIILGVVGVIVIVMLFSKLFGSSYNSVAKDVMKAIETRDTDLLSKQMWVPSENWKERIPELCDRWMNDTWYEIERQTGYVDTLKCRIIEIEKKSEEELADLKADYEDAGYTEIKKIKKLIKVKYEVEGNGNTGIKTSTSEFYVVKIGGKWKALIK